MILETVRAAYRSLRSTKSYTFMAILFISIAIGGNMATFTLVNGIVLKPLAYPESERLVLLTQSSSKLSNMFESVGWEPRHFLRWRREIKSLESLAAAHVASVNLISAGLPETLGALRVSAEFFDTLKVKPQLGRWFTQAEEKRGAADVAILSDSLWRARFSADPGIVGRTIVIGNAPHQVVGVAEGGLRLFHGGQLHPRIEFPMHTDVFLPLRFTAAEELGANPDYAIIGRVSPGSSPEQVRAEIEASLPTFYRVGEMSEGRAIVETLHTAFIRQSPLGLPVAASCSRACPRDRRCQHGKPKSRSHDTTRP